MERAPRALRGPCRRQEAIDESRNEGNTGNFRPRSVSRSLSLQQPHVDLAVDAVPSLWCSQLVLKRSCRCYTEFVETCEQVLMPEQRRIRST